ncbi:hypothetical protein STAS_25209 [Striga asiatica]|uniref:Uncharacterized protein n=1 Tax=Striga asiatica TaxID=4170 RepID=A0A5A7QS51_STRAF|nr:hypothetical protein STAS_25209 [Striga asiatica]
MISHPTKVPLEFSQSSRRRNSSHLISSHVTQPVGRHARCCSIKPPGCCSESSERRRLKTRGCSIESHGEGLRWADLDHLIEREPAKEVARLRWFAGDGWEYLDGLSWSPLDLNRKRQTEGHLLLALRRNCREEMRDDAESKPGAEMLGLILKSLHIPVLMWIQILALFLHCSDDFQGSVSPPFFFGSPPCRASNPVVQDACFGIEPNNLSSIRKSSNDSADNGRKQLGKEQIAVRIEGFDCPNTRAVAMSNSEL